MRLSITILLLSTLLFGMSAKPKIYQDFHITGLKTTEQTMSPEMIAQTLTQAGVSVISTEDLNTLFIDRYKKSDFKHYFLITCYMKDISNQLLKKHPNMGIFYPTRVVVFQKKEDPVLWVALLSSRTMGKVLTLKHREKLLADYDRAILQPIIASMKKSRFKQVNSSQQRELRKLLIHTKEVHSLDQLTSIEQRLKAYLPKTSFQLMHIMDLNQLLGKESPYAFYKSYQMRNIKTLYTKSALYPESAAHTPLHLVIYKKKTSPIMTITQMDTAHVIDSSDITETASLRALSKDQKEMEDLIKYLLH